MERRGVRGWRRCRLYVPLAVERMGAMARHLISIDYRGTGFLARAVRSCRISWSAGVAGSSAHVATLRYIDVSQLGQVIYCSELVDGVLGIIGIYGDVSPADWPSNGD